MCEIENIISGTNCLAKARRIYSDVCSFVRSRGCCANKLKPVVSELVLRGQGQTADTMEPRATGTVNEAGIPGPMNLTGIAYGYCDQSQVTRYYSTGDNCHGRYSVRFYSTLLPAMQTKQEGRKRGQISIFLTSSKAGQIN